MLKEAVEDLEWPGGDVDILMSQDQQRLALSASGSSGDLTVGVLCLISNQLCSLQSVLDWEWPGGDVDILMSQDQQRLTLSASGSSGGLTVDVLTTRTAV